MAAGIPGGALSELIGGSELVEVAVDVGLVASSAVGAVPP